MFISVKAPPDKGKANKAVFKVLAKFFDLKLSQIALVKGQTSRDKLFSLSAVTIQEIEVKLKSLLKKDS